MVAVKLSPGAFRELVERLHDAGFEHMITRINQYPVGIAGELNIMEDRPAPLDRQAYEPFDEDYR